MDLICLNSARQVGCGKGWGGAGGASDHLTPGIRPWKLVSMAGEGKGHKEKWELGVSQEDEERIKDY